MQRKREELNNEQTANLTMEGQHCETCITLKTRNILLIPERLIYPIHTSYIYVKCFSWFYFLFS